MQLSIIAIGDELLLGQVTDTNSGFIARTIKTEGWTVGEVRVVADDLNAIRDAIDQAFKRSRIVVTTGGLGPTKDDITKEALRSYFGGEMQFRDDVFKNVCQFFERRGLQLNDLTRGQAIVPSTADVIQNRCGTAPIMWFEDDIRERVLVAMPGVPFETEQMFVGDVFPRLLAKFPSPDQTVHNTLIISGISESALAEHLADWESTLANRSLHLAYLPDNGIIRLRLDSKATDRQTAQANLNKATEELRRLCSDNLLADGDLTPARILLNALIENGLTVATAESCTGGNIAHMITSEAGSSAAMKGGVIAYDNTVKQRLLGVKASTLQRHGAVSCEVVEEMARGAQSAVGADVAIATSGIAGPGGGTPEKPVGTVCIAVATHRGVESHVYHFAGSRDRVIIRATTQALTMAIKAISNQCSDRMD